MQSNFRRNRRLNQARYSTTPRAKSAVQSEQWPVITVNEQVTGFNQFPNLPIVLRELVLEQDAFLFLIGGLNYDASDSKS